MVSMVLDAVSASLPSHEVISGEVLRARIDDTVKGISDEKRPEQDSV